MANRASRNIRDAALQSLVVKHETPGLPAVPLNTIAATMAAGGPLPPAPPQIGLKVVTLPGREGQAAAWIEARGGRLVSAGAKVLVAELPPESLSQLEECPGIQRAEASRQFQTRLDQARGAATGYDAAIATTPLNGEGVVVGIVDTGVDWSHRDFRNDDGSTRLELFAFASRPNGATSSVINQFDRAAIDAALSGGSAIPQGDPIGHGTHCASIAAGNGLASGGQFQGVAPKTALVAVRSEPLLDDHIIWGIRRAFEVAGSRPAVVTLSLGGHLGPHDGTSALENVIARESGPGRIIIVAAGNEGGDHIHFRGNLVAGQDLVITVNVTDKELVFADVWIPRGDDVDVSIETPDGTRHDPDGTMVSTPFGRFEGHWQEDPVNRDQNLTLFIAQGHPGDIWRIHLHAVTVLQGDVHAWAGTADPSASADLFPNVATDGFSLGMPATEERCIAVASFVSRPNFLAAGGGVVGNGLVAGQLSSFSSHGPSRYGMLKPDVAAPGQYITAALAASSEFSTQPRFASALHASGKYITIQGTSMATPFIAGVVALLLQREPKLTPEEVQQRLRVTARRDAQTGRVWHPGFGFGKIDVQALLEYQN